LTALPVRSAASARPLRALDTTPDELPALLAGLAQPAYRGRQLAGWLFARAVRSYNEMSDLPAALRRQLAECLPLATPEIVDTLRSSDGGTEKVLLRLAGGAAIETVLMRQPTRDGGAQHRLPLHAGRLRYRLSLLRHWPGRLDA